MELSAYKTDTTAVENGKWFPVYDAEIKLVSMTSSRVRTFLRKNERVLSQYSRSGMGVPEDVLEKSLINTLAESVILDWKNFKEAGIEVPFSVENAKRVLTDYPVIREAIAQILNDSKAFTLTDAAYVEESEKN